MQERLLYETMLKSYRFYYLTAKILNVFAFVSLRIVGWMHICDQTLGERKRVSICNKFQMEKSFYNWRPARGTGCEILTS